MRKVKKLRIKDIPQMVDISINAYPGFTYPDRSKYIERVEEIQRQSPVVNYYGCFDDEKLVGVQRLHDFQMNFRCKMLSATGVGGIAVDLLHKKEKVCRDMIRYFLKYAQNKKSPVAILYPFRPDFYVKMGFGYGSPLYQYKLLPEAFPAGAGKEHLRFLSSDDISLLVSFYNQQARQRHGYCLKNDSDFKGFLRNPQNRVIGYVKDGKLDGYLVAKFVKAHKTNFVINNLEIVELVYADRQVFSEFSTFLNNQSDQLKRIILNTFDPEFYQLVNDVRKGNDELFPSVFHDSFSGGIGVMYKIIDLKNFFTQAGNFGNVNLVIKFKIQDSFAGNRLMTEVVSFDRGKCSLSKNMKSDVELSMGIADFSSLVLGSLSFKQALNHGKVILSNDKFAEKIHRLFYVESKPQCLNWF
jgi:predicted acetyltransferase